MDDAAHDARFAFANTLVAEAATLALGYFTRLGSLTITSKGQQDMASEADLNTEILIRGRLKAAFPDDGFLGEETGRDTLTPTDGLWVDVPEQVVNSGGHAGPEREKAAELGLGRHGGRNARGCPGAAIVMVGHWIGSQSGSSTARF